MVSSGQEMDSARFRQLCGRFATGVVVVTATDPAGQDHGMTANSFTSVSLEPPLVSINIEQAANFHGVISRVDRFAINILESEQEAVSRHFAGPAPHQFEGFRRTPGGLVALEGVIATLECEVASRFDVGDHTVVVGRVTGGEVREGRPLLYFRGGYHALG
jgi:flavin reductase (DIM6/NTAB) family NADH-FMN oxidoreductase RutF